MEKYLSGKCSDVGRQPQNCTNLHQTQRKLFRKKVKKLTDDVTGSERCEIFLHNISPSEAAAAFALAFLCI